MKFGPANDQETQDFAIEELKADVQYQILRKMKEGNVSQAELARRLRHSPSWVSQILGDDANLTVESIARIFLALNSKCSFKAGPLPEHFVAATTLNEEESWSLGSGADHLPGRRVDTVAMLIQVICTRSAKFDAPQITNDNSTSRRRFDFQVA